MECTIKKKISGEAYIFVSGDICDKPGQTPFAVLEDIQSLGFTEIKKIKELIWNEKNNTFCSILNNSANQIIFENKDKQVRFVFEISQESKIKGFVEKEKPFCEIKFTKNNQKFLKVNKEVLFDSWTDTGIEISELANLDGIVYLDKGAIYPGIINKFNKEKDGLSQKRYDLFWFNPTDDLNDPWQIIALDVLSGKILVFESLKKEKQSLKTFKDLKQKKITVVKEIMKSDLKSYIAEVCPVDENGFYLISQPMALNKKYLIGFIPDAYPGVSIKYNGEVFTAHSFTDDYSALLFHKTENIKSNSSFSIKYYCESAIAELQYEGFTNGRFFASLHTKLKEGEQQARVSLLLDQPIPFDTFVFMGFPMNTATNLLKQVSSLYYLNKENKFRLRDRNSKYLVFAKEGKEDNPFNQAIALDPVEYLLFMTEAPKKKKESNALPKSIIESFDLDLDWK